jgi:uncharacterized protein with von Willebrand factor type A (vWA) domain
MTGDGGGGKLGANIMHFARVLRAAGIPVGPRSVVDAVRAVETAGITSRDDFYWALHAVLVNRRDQRELFDQAFHIFWRNPRLLERMLGLVLPPSTPPEASLYSQPISRRLDDALNPSRDDGTGSDDAPRDSDAVMTYTPREVLRARDFDDMSADEIRQAKAAVKRMRLPVITVPTRRFAADQRGRRVDMRATLRASLRSGGDIIPLRFKHRRLRPPPLVVLCDISGSMGRYSRMLLHFVHAVTNDRDRVQSFVFGTRLTNITRQLRQRDVDQAMTEVAGTVEDWDGGTRIGECLASFNRDWSRRVLGQGALVLLITDGLDRDAAVGLENQIERLHKSCRRLIWLNPLLRYEGFEPKALGIKTLLPHVDDFRTIHNLESLDDLADALGRLGSPKEEGPSPWLKTAS